MLSVRLLRFKGSSPVINFLFFKIFFLFNKISQHSPPVQSDFRVDKHPSHSLFPISVLVNRFNTQPAPIPTSKLDLTHRLVPKPEESTWSNILSLSIIIQSFNTFRFQHSLQRFPNARVDIVLVAIPSIEF